MNKDGAILVVEDDEDDRFILNLVFKELNFPNEVIFVNNGEQAIDYLSKKESNPFIVFSDINMPAMDGFQLRDAILADKNLMDRTVPFIFLSTSGEKEQIAKAYKKSIQGYFVKRPGFEEYKNLLRNIIEYWLVGRVPVVYHAY